MRDIKKVNTAFNRVRNELCELGLLDDGVYLDEIELIIHWIPGVGEAGFVFDSGVPWIGKVVGYEEGVIYLPWNTSHEMYVPGGTLVDTIRHEFAHAWAWLDREFIDRRWFKQAFGRSYDSQWNFGKSLWRLFLKQPDEFKQSPYYREFVSEYAMFSPYEDFAETFMMCLRYRGSLDRFRSRPGVYQKVTAVHEAIGVAASELGDG